MLRTQNMMSLLIGAQGKKLQVGNILKYGSKLIPRNTWARITDTDTFLLLKVVMYYHLWAMCHD